MEALSRFGKRAGAALICAAVVGCASPEPVAAPGPRLSPTEGVRYTMVQTIPRGAYVERGNEYVGPAPVLVEFRTDGRGKPKHPMYVTATDVATGAFVWRRLSPLEPVPERMLLDLRPFMGL
jgi:hypothetical protein